MQFVFGLCSSRLGIVQKVFPEFVGGEKRREGKGVIKWVSTIVGIFQTSNAKCKRKIDVVIESVNEILPYGR